MMKLKRLRDFPLAFKLWIAISCLVIPCIILMGIIFKFVLNYTRDEVVFSSIEKAQEILKQNNSSIAEDAAGIIPQDYDAVLSVYHIGIKNRQVQYMTFPISKFHGFSTKFIDVMGTSYSSQKNGTKRYKLAVNDYNLYYIVVKNNADGVISFRIDTSNNKVYNTASLIIIVFSTCAALIALLLAILFSRSLVKPLKRLQKSAVKMADGDLETPTEIDRADEIGKLSKEIDKARRELQRRELLKQSAVQYVSHELKTPVMTIRSYAQSILDKVYPQGNLEGSVRVISSQADRLERIIAKLLTIVRLDYLETKAQTAEVFDLAEVVEDSFSRICSTRCDLDIRFDLENIQIEAQREQIIVMIENLLENAVRYAQKVLKISAQIEEGCPALRIFNDGGGISKELMPVLFEVFKKGEKGISGLGLSIVKRTAETCGAEIAVSNRNDGVEFLVLFKNERQ